jgi:DNA-binding HxlR family transcriptional regulator
LGLLSIYSLPASLGAWALFSLTFFRRQQPRNLGAFASRGFDKNIYNLMVKMRGATSRLSLLRGLETPRHRNDLAEITGIDWKEVDRQINVLEKYGLTKVYASSGSIKLFQLTEQGRLLLQLIDELKLSGS